MRRGLGRGPCLWLLALSALVVACDRGVTEAGPPDPASVAIEHEPSPLKRLTAEQYANSLHDLFGDDVVVPTRLEPDIESAGSLNVGAGKTTISPRGVELYETAAFSVAAQVAPRSAEFADCAPAEPGDAACYGALARNLGERLWRRPVVRDEVDRLVAIGLAAGEELGAWEDGVEFVVATMLQSPHFLFRAEPGLLEDGERRALGPYELASRLSFFLWNSGPDEALLAAAEGGELATDAGLEREVDRMLGDPRARRGVRAIFTDLYGLHRLDDVTKAPEVYPHFSDTFAASATEETLRMLEHHVFEERRDFRDVMTTRSTFVNRELAAVYGVRAPAREGFAALEFEEDSARAGLLGHASILALNAHPVATSPTLRGIFVRTKLLCQKIPPPPADVDTSIPEPSGTAPTLRDRIQEHLENPACSGCHNLTDPIGLGMERFDGVGRFRELDNGHEIDTTGAIDGTDFEGLSTLAQALREHPNFTSCFARSLYGYATSQEIGSGQQALVDALDENFAAADYDALALMKAVVLSSGFRYAGDPAEQEDPAGGEQ